MTRKRRAGQILTEELDHHGRPTNGTHTYTYDPLDRLRTVARSGTTIRFRYVGLTTSQAQVVDHGTSAVIRHIGTDWTGGRLGMIMSSGPTVIIRTGPTPDRCGDLLRWC
ncbi:hypothetical protein BH20CHL7_BH20CHL7_07170 [soil metagenome]